MKEKGIQCCHQIKRFQFHKGCERLAGICKKQCQKMHDGDVNVLSVEAVEDYFKGIRDHIIKQIRSHKDKLRESYNQMIHELQRQQAENIKHMERQMLNELMKNIDLQKSFVDKIENERYQRIRCNELRNFMEESNIQQKIKKSAHINVFTKYQAVVNSFKEKFFKFSTELLQSKAPQKNNIDKSQRVNHNIQKLPVNNQRQVINLEENSKSDSKTIAKGSQNQGTNKLPYYFQKQQLQQEKDKAKQAQQKALSLQKEKIQLENQVRRIRFDFQVLKTDKKNLQRQFQRQVPRRKPNLTLGTWNIFRLKTKKIKKEIKIIHVQENNRVEFQEQPNNDSESRQDEIQPEQQNASYQQEISSSRKQPEEIQVSESRNEHPQPENPRIEDEDQEKVQRNCLIQTAIPIQNSLRIQMEDDDQVQKSSEEQNPRRIEDKMISEEQQQPNSVSNSQQNDRSEEVQPKQPNKKDDILIVDSPEVSQPNSNSNQISAIISKQKETEKQTPHKQLKQKSNKFGFFSSLFKK